MVFYMWNRSVEKFLRCQSTVKYVIYLTCEVEEVLENVFPIVVLWKSNILQSAFEQGFLCCNLSNFSYNRRRVFFRSFPFTVALFKRNVLILGDQVKLPAQPENRVHKKPDAIRCKAL